MSNEIYNNRPQRIIEKLQQHLKPLGYQLAFSSTGELRSIKRGQNSKPCPYFYKDERGRINMKMKMRNGDTITRLIDKETDDWLAYYVYKEITK